MAWHEDDGRQNQQKWHARMARERLDLSASVKEALASDDLQEQFWLDEAEEKGSSPSHQMQNTNALMRLAQRLTSPFLALGPSKQASPPLEEAPQPFVSQSILPEPFCYEREAGPVKEHVEAQKESAVRTFHLLSDHIEPSSSVQGRQRLAGRTTKIRLQTAPHPAKLKADQPAVSQSLPKEEQGIGIVEEHAMKSASSTSSHLPIVTTAPRDRCFGFGVLKAGQSEATVVNTQVLLSSVVQVMLTTYPGPVVVQYVSLQPHKGFTVHLTAPVTVDVPFNYVILLNESY